MNSGVTLVAITLILILDCHPANTSCIIAPLLENDPPTTCELKLEGQQEAGMITLIKHDVEFNVVVDYVSRVFNKSMKDCHEVIGVVGDLDLKTARIIHTLASRANLNITLVSAVAPSTFLPTTHLALPNLIHMNPLTHYVEALAAFLDHLNWTRIGLISDDTPYYEFAAELIQQKLLENTKRRIVPFVRISERDNKTNTIKALKDYGTNVAVISASVTVACSLVHKANQLGLKWPDYAWILPDVGLYLTRNTCMQKDRVILLQDLSQKEKQHFRCNTSTPNFLNLCNGTLLSSSLVALHKENVTLKFRNGKRLRNISISQISTSWSHENIAFYDAEFQSLRVLNDFMNRNKPRGTTKIKYFLDHNSALHTTLVVLDFLLLFSFVTIVFTLYIFFRKEPEIKATSVTVSLSMFLACYFLALHIPLIIQYPTVDFHCHLLIWLGIAGVPLPLIIATLIVKMLRIYLIFSDPLSYKKKLFTDPYLFLYILCIVTPSLFTLLLWSSYDPYSVKQLEFPKKNLTVMHTKCLSKNTIKWLTVLLTYAFVLACVLMCLAVKTSKIRYKHFKDTKATNAFAFLSIFVTTLTLIYWYFFRLEGLNLDAVIATRSFVYAGESLIVLLCQALLFVPKVYPPLKRKIAPQYKKQFQANHI